MDLDTVWKLDATAQAELVRRGDVTAGELVEQAIARIDRVNPRINAVITPLYDLAREHAAAVDRTAPFAGVPILLKDASIEVEGTPYYAGTRVLRDAGYRSKQTTRLAHRLRAAGFTFIGKTNVPELSADITTEPVAFGPTRNPWDLTRSPSGSSGGSAAAVAAGLTSIAHGADATGSLRYPAAACGVVTLKPSRGLVPADTPGQPDLLGVWTEFVLARSVRDLAGVLAAVADVALDVSPSARTRLRVGLLKRDVMAGIPTDDACVRAVEIAGGVLAELGHVVEEAHPPALDGVLLRTHEAMMTTGRVLRHAQLRWLGDTIGRPITQDEVEPQLWVSDEDAAKVTAQQFVDASSLLVREMRPVLDWWADGWDVLVTPVLRQPAWPLGSKNGALDAGVFPAVFSLTGQPAMSLPLHWTGGGLPVGVQLVAGRGRDALLLRLAAQIEAAAPWADRWPEVAF